MAKLKDVLKDSVFMGVLILTYRILLFGSSMGMGLTKDSVKFEYTKRDLAKRKEAAQ